MIHLYLKIPENFCVSFSRTDPRFNIYHFFVVVVVVVVIIRKFFTPILTLKSVSKSPQVSIILPSILLSGWSRFLLRFPVLSISFLCLCRPFQEYQLLLVSPSLSCSTAVSTSCIHYLSAGWNLNLLHNSQWIASPTHSYLQLYSF